MELEKAIKQLSVLEKGNDNLKILDETDILKREILFLSAVEKVSKEDEWMLSNLIIDTYNSVLSKHREMDKLKSIESFKQSQVENKMSEERENTIMEQILNIFKDWEKGGFVTVDVPEEITFKELKTLFLTTFNEIPFEKKIAGAMTEEIYNLSVELSSNKRPKKQKVGKEDQKEIMERLQELISVADIVNQYLSNPVTLTDIESVQLTETQLLGMMFDSADEETFCEFMKEEKVSKTLRKLAIERKLPSIVLKSKKRRNVVKKWDGEGEPFRETNSKKEPSLTYELWKKILEKECKIDALNKWATKKFGAKPNGDQRDVSRILVKMKKKVENFYNIEIGETVSVTTI